MLHLAPTALAQQQASGFRLCLRDIYARLAEAERTGRAKLDPAQTALVVEIAGAAFRKGCEVEAAIVHSALAEAEIAATPLRLLPRN